LHGVSINDRNEDVYGFLDHILIPLEQRKVKPNHTSPTPWKKRENKFIYAFILMSKFNYKSSIIIIVCFKYLLTLFMDDIGVIDSYLFYQRLMRLLCGYVPYIISHPHLKNFIDK